MVMIGTSNARKQRNAVVITIPSKFGIEAGKKFYIIKEDESLRLVPEKEDFFERLDELNLGEELEEINEKYVP